MSSGLKLFLLGLLCLPGDPERDALAGWYEVAPGRHALVTYGASGGMRLFDFDELTFDVLAPRPKGFDWKRQADPGEASVEFVRDTTGRVTGYGWSTVAGQRGQVRRDESFGYAQAEVRFRSGEVELCALLMLPRGGGKHPGAVVVQGSGDSDRDNAWAFSIANHLALSGIAVLLPDKRGCGQSQGSWRAVAFEELAGDALAGFALLAARAEVDPKHVGLVGLSEGGSICPLAARRDPRVAYAASVSCAPVVEREQILHEFALTSGLAGGDDSVGVALGLMNMALDYGKTGAGWDRYVAGVAAAPAALAEGFPTKRDDWRWSWYRHVVDFDPLPLWRDLSIPTYFVLGAEEGRDSVPLAQGVARLRSLARSNLAWKVYPGSGYWLEDPATGRLRRDFLDELVLWIRAIPAR